MPVPSSITDLSTTAASNSPAGTDPIGTSLDDYLRAIQAIIRAESLNKSWEAPSHVATWVSGTQFTVPTDLTSAYRVGRRLKVTLAGPTYAYSTITNSSFAAGATTVTVVNDSSALTSPITAIELGPDYLALLASSTTLFDGVRAATQAAGDSSTKVATTAYADRAAAGVQVIKGLRASASGTSANVTVTADAISLYNASTGLSLVARSVSLTINTGAAGANGLDTGALASNVWYSVWVIAKADGTVAGLLSTSATAPTMPTDYIYRTRVGWIRTDATANKYPLSFIQRDRRVSYKVAAGSNVAAQRELASGSAGSINGPTWVAQATGDFVPSTAVIIRVAMCNTGSTTQMVAPNDAYSAHTGTNPGNVLSGIGTMPVDIILESTDVHWASNNATNKLFAVGWEDAL